MADFNEIKKARKLLGLGEEASLADIKNAYRGLSLKYHPDKCPDSKKKICEEMFKEIARANEILMIYCANYKYSFKEKDVRTSAMNKGYHDHLKRFYDGWWGDLNL